MDAMSRPSWMAPQGAMKEPHWPVAPPGAANRVPGTVALKAAKGALQAVVWPLAVLPRTA